MDGRGVPGEVPPLAGSIWVVGSKERLGQVIHRGLEGPLTFGDRTYDAVMPAVGAQLGEEDLAALMNYVRNSFGNLAEEVTGAEAAEIRKRAGSASSRWQVKALLAEYPLEN
jgi:mono/diheme cytochrome c family protein